MDLAEILIVTSNHVMPLAYIFAVLYTVFYFYLSEDDTGALYVANEGLVS